MGKPDDQWRTYLVHLLPTDDYFAAYVRSRNQRGREALRRVDDVVRVPRLPGDSLPDVLRRVAAALELPPRDRWRPRV